MGFAIGFMFGALCCAVAGMVGYCVLMENKYPELRPRFLHEEQRVEDDPDSDTCKPLSATLQHEGHERKEKDEQ